MKTSDFSYELPPLSIAQTPAQPRESCRLAVLDRFSGRVDHVYFSDFGRFLRPGDCLVLNNSKVVPLRVPCRKMPTGAAVEALLLKSLPAEGSRWEALLKPGRRAKPGARLEPIRAGRHGIFVVEGKDQEGVYQLAWQGEALNTALLEKIGLPPLPPYIKRDYFSANAAAEAEQDRIWYQTVFASSPGSAAAPTAGLHFSPKMMDSLKKQGIRFVEVTLHVGMGTFLPVKEDDPSRHVMHEEEYEISPAAVALMDEAKKAGGRIIAVGTTSLRVLESACDQAGRLVSRAGKTRLFILPGYKFKVVEALLTNFHVPGSTLLMLVSAMDSRERILSLYEECLAKGYRFLSYGDAMFLS